MKNLVRILEDCRKSKIINNYSVETGEQERGQDKNEAFLSIYVNRLLIIRKSLIYNTGRNKFSKVSDLLLEQAEQQLVVTGLMSLYSNKTESITALDKSELNNS